MKRILVILAMLIAINANAQWVQVSNGMPYKYVYSLAISGNNIFAGTDLYGVYRSTNYGQSWSQMALNDKTVFSLAVIGNNIFAGCGYSLGVYLSTNNGLTWTQTSLNNRKVISLVSKGDYIFAGTSGGGVYISTNNGTTWTQTSLNDRTVESLAISGNNIFAGTSSYGVCLSTNNGLIWTQTSLNNVDVSCLAINGNNIFAGTSGVGVYLSTNNGQSWTNTGTNTTYIESLAIIGNNIFAGAKSDWPSLPIPGVHYSSNNGSNWIPINQGWNNGIPWIYSLLIANNYIFAGTNGLSIYRRSLSEIISIQNISTETPSKYSLSQNYPNPFNSTSNLKFQIVNTGDVKLIVYDIMGKEVQTLVNERLQPGTYEAAFDGSLLNSGVYFYKLVTNGFTETKKMLLIK